MVNIRLVLQALHLDDDLLQQETGTYQEDGPGSGAIAAVVAIV